MSREPECREEGDRAGSSSPCGRGAMARLICETVHDLMSLYHTDSEDSPESAGGLLPNKARVIEVQQLLRDVIFPGMCCPDFSLNGHLESFIDERLSRSYRLLVPEIAKALPFRWKGEFAKVMGVERDVEDVNAAAEQITAELLRRLPDLRRRLILDVKAAYDGDPAALSYAEVVLTYPGVQAITSHRIAHELYRMDVPLVPRIMSEWTHAETGIDIHPGAQIGDSFFIDHGTGVVIGETCRIGNRVKIYQGVTLGAKSFPLDEQGRPIKHIQRHPTIEDDVVIYSGATILGGDTVIGRGSTIGGNVFLVKSVPPHSTVLQKAVGLEIRNADGSTTPL